MYMLAMYWSSARLRSWRGRIFAVHFQTERERRNPLSPHSVPELLPAELSAQAKLDRLLVFARSACVHNRGHYDGYAEHDY